MKKTEDKRTKHTHPPKEHYTVYIWWSERNLGQLEVYRAWGCILIRMYTSRCSYIKVVTDVLKRELSLWHHWSVRCFYVFFCCLIYILSIARFNSIRMLLGMTNKLIHRWSHKAVCHFHCNQCFPQCNVQRDLIARHTNITPLLRTFLVSFLSILSLLRVI